MQSAVWCLLTCIDDDVLERIEIPGYSPGSELNWIFSLLNNEQRKKVEQINEIEHEQNKWTAMINNEHK